MVRALYLRGRVARSGPALTAYARGADIRTDRRHRRLAHDLATGDHRRVAQLGLPLLLDAGCDADARGLPHRRLPTRGAALAPMAVAGRGRRSEDAADH